MIIIFLIIFKLFKKVTDMNYRPRAKIEFQIVLKLNLIFKPPNKKSYAMLLKLFF